jgi:hypothetical protein
MDTHKNAVLTPKGREQMVRAVVDSGLSQAAAAQQFKYGGQDGGEVGKAVPRCRRGWLVRPLVATSFLAEPNTAYHE